MSLVSTARGIWRAAAPAGVRRLAQPVLAPALRAHVRREARAAPRTPAQGPIHVVGWFSGSHGIAASAKLAARAFEALDVPVVRVDVTGGQPSWTPALNAPTPASAWIFHLNPPELLAALGHLGPRRVVGPRYGYWAWELPAAPRAWLREAALVDEVWAPSAYTAAALAGAAAPVRTVPHPLFLEDYADIAPAPREPRFLAVALFDFKSSVARKNPQGAIAAFARAFGGRPDARLMVKTQNGAAFPELLAELRRDAPANVEILDATWPYAEVMRLIAAADVLVSLHRAEGFGLVMAEAMALGTPVVATAFSGNLDFTDEGCAALVPARPTPVRDPQGIYAGQSWAEPDLDAAAAALRALWADPERGRRMAEAGRRRLAERLSPAAWFATLPPQVRAAAEALRAGG